MAEVNKTYDLVCIKPNCGVKYKSKDPDPYYCGDCYKESKEIAKKIDAEFAGRVTPTKEYDEIERWKREGGFMPIIK